MTDSLKGFIDRRKTELAAEADQLRKRIATIESELKELDLVETSLISKTIKQTRAEIETRNRHFILPNTIKSDVIRILYKKEMPMLALDILSIINVDRFPPLERTSLSPQLSRLKADGLLKLDGSAWSLTEKGIEEAKHHQK